MGRRDLLLYDESMTYYGKVYYTYYVTAASPWRPDGSRGRRRYILLLRIGNVILYICSIDTACL